MGRRLLHQPEYGTACPTILQVGSTRTRVWALFSTSLLVSHLPYRRTAARGQWPDLSMMTSGALYRP